MQWGLGHKPRLQALHDRLYQPPEQQAAGGRAQHERLLSKKIRPASAAETAVTHRNSCKEGCH
jgi:hypothetical protein